MPLLAAVEKAPIASLDTIVMNRLSTKECAAFSNVSDFGVHIENGSFSKRTIFKFMHFHERFRKAPFSRRRNVNARANQISFAPFSYENGAV